MSKYLKYILIICPIILSILLVVNIYKYKNTKINNNNFIETTKQYELKIKDNTDKIKQLENELTSIKEEKKDKIEELEKWNKWKKEITDLIN